MINFQYDMFNKLEIPTIILSTKYHKHLDKLNTIDLKSIRTNNQMASQHEVSFTVYKEFDGKKCELWNQIVDFKYIYIPEYYEYYEIKISVDENNETIKHVVGTSACKAELSTRRLYNFECNTTEVDVLRDDYVPTIFYNKENPKASLLHRVLNDKCPDYTIKHVDKSIAQMQRILSANDVDIFSFLTTTVSEKFECIFIFDSVNRTISVYDLKYFCNQCGYRGDETKVCPECGNTNMISYGLNTNVYISAENYAQSITIEGNTDNVFNCLRIEGGDELMTATVANINPNGTAYIYNFSSLMKEDMPDELVSKLEDYNQLYNDLSSDYLEYTQEIYDAINEELYLTNEMMPGIVIPETTAQEELDKLLSSLSNVAVNNISSLSLTSADLAVKGMAKVLIDARYDVEVIESSLSGLQNSKRTWKGKFVITNNSNEDDNITSLSLSSVVITGDNYEQYLYQKIQKKLGNEDSTFNTIFEIEDMNVFKSELSKYCLNRLKSFESSYQTCLEVLIENGVTNTTPLYLDVNLYEEMYLPYYNRIIAIQEELLIREQAIKEIQNTRTKAENNRNGIQEQLNLQKYLGQDLWIILSHYLKESTYTNSNYTSVGLSNAELLDRAKELFQVASKEVIKASTLQFTLTSSLNNLLNINEFAPFRDKIALGNWINVKVDDIVYRLRLIQISIDYGNLDKIDVAFSTVTKIQDVLSDAESVIAQAQAMSLTYDTVTHQASQGEVAKSTIDEYRNIGLNTTLYNIVNTYTQDVKVDEHGISCRLYDDIIDNFCLEELRIINNTIAFTKDGWKTVSAALGKLKYTLNGVDYEDYGLNADHVISGTIIGGNIYSYNYLTDENGNIIQGSHFNLIDGSLELAGGKLVYDATTNKLSMDGSIICDDGVIGGWDISENGMSSISSVVYGGDFNSFGGFEYKFDGTKYVLTATSNLISYENYLSTILSDGQIIFGISSLPEITETIRMNAYSLSVNGDDVMQYSSYGVHFPKGISSEKISTDILISRTISTANGVDLDKLSISINDFITSTEDNILLIRDNLDDLSVSMQSVNLKSEEALNTAQLAHALHQSNLIDDWVKTSNNKISITSKSISKDSTFISTYIQFTVNTQLNNEDVIFTTDYKGRHGSLPLTLRNGTSPYTIINDCSIWISITGNVQVFGTLAPGIYYISGEYMYIQ